MQSRHDLVKPLAIHTVPEVHISKKIMGFVGIVGAWVFSDYGTEILFGSLHTVQRCLDSRSVKEWRSGMLDGSPQYEHLISIVCGFKAIGLRLGRQSDE